MTLALEDPAGAPLPFTAGQFLTVLVGIDGATHRRAYSLSSSPFEPGGVSITVKRVRDGRVSNHLNDRARAGDLLSVLGPSGSFTVEPAPDARRHYVLLAGGSGITPMMAIARAVLSREPASRVSLVYGNRRLEDVIFRDALDLLAAEHPERFCVRHVLAEPPSGWSAGTGLLDRAALERELDALAPCDRPAEYLVCGPEPMMAHARDALRDRGVPAERVREERFSQPHLRDGAAARAPGGRMTLRVAGRAHAVVPRPGETVLEAGLAAGLAMPFSCAMGGCGACMVRVREGSVEMEEPNCLTPEERAQGYALACVGRAREGSVLEVPE